MKRLAIIAAALLITISGAHARTLLYACRYGGDDSKLYSAKLDLSKKTITWQGSIYNNLKEISGSVSTDDCAKQCFVAKRRDGAPARLDTATQGVASLTVLVGKTSDKVEVLDCDLVRENR